MTNLGAAGGVIGAMIIGRLLQRTLDIGMIGNGAIAGLVAITAPSGYVEFWAAPIIGLVGGLLVVACVLAIEKKLDTAEQKSAETNTGSEKFKVEIGNVPAYVTHVEIPAERLREHGLTLGEVARIIESSSEDIPAGDDPKRQRIGEEVEVHVTHAVNPQAVVAFAAVNAVDISESHMAMASRLIDENPELAHHHALELDLRVPEGIADRGTPGQRGPQHRDDQPRPPGSCRRIRSRFAI